jgi:hypothetical protein
MSERMVGHEFMPGWFPSPEECPTEGCQRFVGHDGDHYPEPGDTPCETDDTGVIHMR